MSIPTSLNPMGVATNPEPLYYNYKVDLQSGQSYILTIYDENAEGKDRSWFYMDEKVELYIYWLDDALPKWGILLSGIEEVEGLRDLENSDEFAKNILVKNNYDGFTITPIPVYE